MIEPTLEEYGLNDFKLRQLSKRENTKTRIDFLVFALTFISAMIYYVVKQTPMSGTSEIIVVLIAGFFLATVIAIFSMILSIIATIIVSDLNKDNKNLKSYERAIKEFKEWDHRNKETYWKSMDGFTYEREVGKLFQNKGYQVTTTKGSGDGGVDIILRKDGNLTIVQCKNTKKPVGPAIVRDLYGTMINFRAHEAILVSTSGCSKGAKQFMFGKPMSVISLAHLIEMNK